MKKTIFNFLILFVFLIPSSFIGGLAHEIGHFLVGLYFDWKPIIIFEAGGFVNYQTKPDTIPHYQNFIALFSGPVVTFILAFVSFRIFKRYRFLSLLAFCIWNTMFRLSVLIDGQNSDEAKMSKIFHIPYLFESLSVIISLMIYWKVMKIQKFVPNHFAWMPVYFVVSAVAYRLSFGLVAQLF